MGNYQSGDNTIQGERLSRREAVFDKMDDDSFALFYAGRRKYSSGESLFPFAVNKDFYYLTGIEQEGSSLLLSKRGGECREFLFIDPYEESKRRFYGKKLSIDEAKRLTGIPNVLLSTYLTSRLDRLLRQGLDGEEPVKKGYFDYSPELKIGPELDVKTFVNSLKVVYPDLHDLDARPLVMPLRKCKSDSEVEEIKKAAGYAKEGLLSAYSVLRPGAYLYDLGLFYEHAANSASSCSGLCHLPHIASGEEACYRDPFPGQKQAKEGEIVLLDVGAKSGQYGASICRSVPVSGRYTPHQALIYKIVLNCLRAMENLARPLISLKRINEFALDYLASECLREGLLPSKEAIYSIAYPNMVCELGLDCPEDYGELTLEEGDVIALYPGLYLSSEGTAIKLKDVYLVTERGCRRLSDADIEIEDIERRFALQSK